MKSNFLSVPWWATKGFQILVNGEKQSIASKPGSYATVERTWANGDRVEVVMPMTLRMEGFKDNPQRAAVMFGPLVMAGITDKNNPFSAIVAKDADFLDTLKPVAGKPVEFTAPPEIFRTSPVAVADKPVVFRPLYQFVDDAYAIYWDVVNPAEFQRVAFVFETEIQRQKELAARTVDLVASAVHSGVITFQRLFIENPSWLPANVRYTSEKAHEVKFSEPKTTPRKEREAAAFAKRLQSEMVFNIRGEFHSLNPGEWRSYQMKVLPDKTQQLVVRLWKAPTKGLEQWLQKQGKLEVLVNGQVVGTCEVETLPVSQFSDVTCPLPPELIRNKAKVEVLLQVPSNSSTVFGIYECRIATSK